MELPEKVSECAIKAGNNGRPSIKEVCSPDIVISKMEAFAGTKGPKREVIERAMQKVGCDGEKCVLESKEFKEFAGEKLVERVLKQHFKDVGPADSFAWLSNSDVDGPLQKIADEPGSTYMHVRFQMRDFADKKMSDEEIENMRKAMTKKEFDEMLLGKLANIDFVEKIKSGVKSFGTVFNTDYSTGRGQHWFAVYGDFASTPMTLEYFNSSGDPPLSEVRIWLDTTKHKLEKALNRKTEVVVCPMQHQTDTHSCGAYSVYYIISRLSGVPYTTFHRTVVPDKRMHGFRKMLFASKSKSV